MMNGDWSCLGKGRLGVEIFGMGRRRELGR